MLFLCKCLSCVKISRFNFFLAFTEGKCHPFKPISLQCISDLRTHNSDQVNDNNIPMEFENSNTVSYVDESFVKLMDKLQNTGPLIYILLNHSSAYCVPLRS